MIRALRGGGRFLRSIWWQVAIVLAVQLAVDTLAGPLSWWTLWVVGIPTAMLVGSAASAYRYRRLRARAVEILRGSTIRHRDDTITMTFPTASRGVTLTVCADREDPSRVQPGRYGIEINGMVVSEEAEDGDTPTEVAAKLAVKLARAGAKRGDVR